MQYLFLSLQGITCWTTKILSNQHDNNTGVTRKHLHTYETESDLLFKNIANKHQIRIDLMRIIGGKNKNKLDYRKTFE